MKNELTADEWLALSLALDFINETTFIENYPSLEEKLDDAIEKVKDTANNIKERNK